MCTILYGKQKSEIDFGFLIGVRMGWGGVWAGPLVKACRGGPVNKVECVPAVFGDGHGPWGLRTHL